MEVMRKKRPAKEYKDGDEVFDDLFIVNALEKRSMKNGNPYYTLTLGDASGEIGAKVWFDLDADLYKKGTYIKVRGKATSYRDKVELNLDKLRPLDPATECIALEDFVPTGPQDRFALLEDLKGIFSGCAPDVRCPPLVAMAMAFLEDPIYSGMFRDAPAASKLHQPYIGGLIEHTLSLIGLLNGVMEHYYRHNGEVEKFDYDVLVTGILFHDSGKMLELSWNPSIQYTTAGTVIGHVGMGMQILQSFKHHFWNAVTIDDDREVMAKRLLHVEHIVASHHGLRDWGAIATPHSREACLFHYLDCIDARMGEFDIAEKEGTGEFRGRMRTTNAPAWFPAVATTKVAATPPANKFPWEVGDKVRATNDYIYRLEAADGTDGFQNDPTMVVCETLGTTENVAIGDDVNIPVSRVGKPLGNLQFRRVE